MKTYRYCHLHIHLPRFTQVYKTYVATKNHLCSDGFFRPHSKVDDSMMLGRAHEDHEDQGEDFTSGSPGPRGMTLIVKHTSVHMSVHGCETVSHCSKHISLYYKHCPLVNQHNYGKSQCLWGMLAACSIAMSVYQRVSPVLSLGSKSCSPISPKAVVSNFGPKVPGFTCFPVHNALCSNDNPF
jgi:hypothetical protein